MGPGVLQDKKVPLETPAKTAQGKKLRAAKTSKRKGRSERASKRRWQVEGGTVGRE